MKRTFTIGEISELLGIPKSTLRYWESVGLIDMPRDSLNNYRRYHPSAVYTISDLAHYRCLSMPLEDMKRLPQLSPQELSASLINLDQLLDNRLEELYTAKEYIKNKIKYIETFEALNKNQYKIEDPSYDKIFFFSIDDTEAWSVYIKDQYQNVLLYTAENGSIVTGMAVPTSEIPTVIWEKDSKATYVSFVLKVGYSNPVTDDFTPHVEQLKKNGYKVTHIFARYLFSACDERYYDYYKAFAEVYK
ncbi:MAG TPA: MerR family transcriptional regulator [Mobilitalea sp.]|nr:MerR family transcriptional regulator [Mobilitalea sp.]